MGFFSPQGDTGRARGELGKLGRMHAPAWRSRHLDYQVYGVGQNEKESKHDRRSTATPSIKTQLFVWAFHDPPP
jgi:hypothetical protein